MSASKSSDGILTYRTHGSTCIIWRWSNGGLQDMIRHRNTLSTTCMLQGLKLRPVEDMKGPNLKTEGEMLAFVKCGLVAIRRELRLIPWRKTKRHNCRRTFLIVEHWTRTGFGHMGVVCWAITTGRWAWRISENPWIRSGNGQRVRGRMAYEHLIVVPGQQ